MSSKLTIDDAVRLARQAGGRDVVVDIHFDALSAEQATRLRAALAELDADEIHVRVHDTTENVDEVELELSRLGCKPHHAQHGNSRWISSSEYAFGPVTFCAFLREGAA